MIDTQQKNRTRGQDQVQDQVQSPYSAWVGVRAVLLFVVEPVSHCCGVSLG